MSGKTRKTFLKRVKILKNGNYLRRIAGQNHFLSKKSSKKLNRIKKMAQLKEFLVDYKFY